MEVISKSNFIRISPRKLRLIADALRGLKTSLALVALENLNKRGAKPMLLTLKQGIANATNNFKLDKSQMIIKKLEINEGPTYKRWIAVSRGQGHSILKRTSHIVMVLEGEPHGTKS